MSDRSTPNAKIAAGTVAKDGLLFGGRVDPQKVEDAQVIFSETGSQIRGRRTASAKNGYEQLVQASGPDRLDISL